MSVPLKAHRVVVNALSIDVEDYFQVWALARWFPRAKWDETPCRVEQNLDVILRLLDDAGAQATFFTLGWIAERFPDLVRRIAAAGHEIASHGYAHARVDELDRKEREQVLSTMHRRLSALEPEEMTLRFPIVFASGRRSGR